MRKISEASPLPSGFLRLSSRRANVLLYAGAVFLFWLSLYAYVPTLPTYVESKTDSLALVGIILAQYGLWQAILRFPLGVAADALGRQKPFIVAGFALSALGALALASAKSIGQLAVGRAVTGLAAATWVPLVVVFTALFPASDTVRATALLTFIASAGRMLATGLNGPLNELGGYQLSFYVAAGAAGLAILIVLPAQSRRRPARRPSFSGIGRLIARRDVSLPAILSAISQYASWAGTFGFFPILAQRLGATDIILSVLMTLHIGVVTAANLAASAIVNRTGARSLVYAGFLALAGSLALAALAPSLLFLFIAQVGMGLSQGIAYPVLMGLSIRHVDQENRATAMGLHQAVYAIGMFAGPWFSGILADRIGIQPMLGVTAFACLILGVLLTRLIPRRV
jgi:MFS family permease